MTTPTFAFVPDPQRRLMRICMAGFYAPQDVARFAAALDMEFVRVGTGFSPHVTLIDMRGMQIQTQETVEAFARVLGSPKHRARRLAFVVEPGLARMQIKRIATSRGARYFTELEEAEAWLLADDAVATFPFAKAG